MTYHIHSLLLHYMDNDMFSMFKYPTTQYSLTVVIFYGGHCFPKTTKYFQTFLIKEKPLPIKKCALKDKKNTYFSFIFLIFSEDKKSVWYSISNMKDPINVDYAEIETLFSIKETHAPEKLHEQVEDKVVGLTNISTANNTMMITLLVV